MSSSSYPKITLGLILGGVIAVGSPFLHAQEVGTLPEVVVTAQKEEQSAQRVPISLSAVPVQTIENAGVRFVKDASIFAPNIWMSEFTARKLSNPRFRGIGSSPNNPGITTYIDGVPQLNANTSSQELIGINQIEFVRGPQSTLFGRNAVGGVINVTSLAPSLSKWEGAMDASYGNFDYRDVRMSLSGPITEDKMGVGFSAGYSEREGYSRNLFTGNDLDSRKAFFGKGQILLKSSEQFGARLLLSGEHASDGDYGLGDLAGIRATPHRVSRDFEGVTQRDIVSPTLLLNWHGENVELASITGGVWWSTFDSTDLDYTPAPLILRQNTEEQYQLTQEIRFSSAKDSPITLSDELALHWQAGVFLFHQDYNQSAGNDLLPFTFINPLPFTLRNQTDSDLKDAGVGLFAQTTLTAWEKLDFTAGLRFDYESKEAELRSATLAPIPLPLPPPTVVGANEDFAQITPQLSITYRFTEAHSVYASFAGGYKAGGFNPVSPAGTELYSEETCWSYEVGFKTRWWDNRLQVNGSAFYIHWDNIQLNVPHPVIPATFYLANVGSAASKGLELEVAFRPIEQLEIFAGVGYTDAEFLGGSMDSGVNIGGRNLPSTPEYTINGGVQLTQPVCEKVRVFARAEVVAYGDFDYDAINAAGQDAYTLANFRAGVRGDNWFVEGYARNAFDTEYVPIAFGFGLAPSGYLGENGAPVTFGVRAGFSF